jgi:hypothetical protein
MISGPGFETIFSQTVTSPSSESWNLKSAGGLASSGFPYAMTRAESISGKEDIAFQGYSGTGTKSVGTDLNAPNLSGFAAGATNQIINPDSPGQTALEFTPNAVAGSGFSVAWSEQVNDTNGTHYQVEFAIFKPANLNVAGNQTPTIVASYAFAVPDAQNIRSVSIVQMAAPRAMRSLPMAMPRRQLLLSSTKLVR